MKVQSDVEGIYKVRNFFLVLCCVLLSKSLFYENLGNNFLLGAFLGYLLITVKPFRLRLKITIICYMLFFMVLIAMNQETKLSSSIVLLLRFFIALYIVHFLSFKVFSEIYVRIMFWLCLISLLYVFVIFFKVHSILPDFVGADDRPLRNFFFFGVSENFIKYGIYRNSGLWWEPGAFQLFVNLAFVFSLVNRSVNSKLYVVLGLTVISTLSTTGVLVFIVLSFIYFKNIIKESKKKVYYIIVFSLFILIAVVVGLPFIILKFGVGDAAEQSVSFLSRYYDFIISYNMFLENPLIGYGFGSQIENAIPYGKELMGNAQYEIIKPTGSDGLTMLVAQCGIFSLILIKPFIFPKYALSLSFFERCLLSFSLIVMFNTQNFVYVLLFVLLCFYGFYEPKRKQFF